MTKELPNINYTSVENYSSGETGKVVSMLIVGNKDSSGNTDPQVLIQEVSSPSMSITDSADEQGTNSNWGFIPTFFFDSALHAWMMVGSDIYGH